MFGGGWQLDVMQRRRDLLMAHGRKLDTTPKIAEYGKYWSRTFGITNQHPSWCITDWYGVVDAPSGDVKINGYVGDDGIGHTFQYYFSDGSKDWFYFNGINPRTIPASTSKKLTSITFSIVVAEIDNSYAFVVETGQILFAGKNTPYYGHHSIYELN